MRYMLFMDAGSGPSFQLRHTDADTLAHWVCTPCQVNVHTECMGLQACVCALAGHDLSGLSVDA